MRFAGRRAKREEAFGDDGHFLVIFYFTRPRRFFAMKELLQKVLRTRSGIIMERQKEGRYT